MTFCFRNFNAPNKLGDAFRRKQARCQKLGDHIANLKQNIRDGIQDLGELGGQFETANFLNQAQLEGRCLVELVVSPSAFATQSRALRIVC